MKTILTITYLFGFITIFLGIVYFILRLNFESKKNEKLNIFNVFFLGTLWFPINLKEESEYNYKKLRSMNFLLGVFYSCIIILLIVLIIVTSN